MLKPMSFRPASGDSPPKCNSASASLPAGLPRSFGVILTVMVSELWLVCIVLFLLGTVIGSFVRCEEPSRASWRGQKAPDPPDAATPDAPERAQVSWHGRRSGALGAGPGPITDG